MALTPMSPGTLLDGRYHLDVLLAEHDGARFWRATDTVLARSVAVHIVSSDDPRAPRVLAAARSSAAVTDPHFLRVLDCSDVDGTTWVINEWGDGVSLDVMLARGTLPAMRAAWLTREVAEAIVAAHAQHLCHGRLNPEAVLVTESGAVKLIGFLVNAAFERQPTPVTTSPYGPVDQREADVIDLAGILYAALTGKWPGIAPSALPPAPKEGNRPLRPRQVRAGVPRTLDAICDRVLHKEAFQHSMPIETALEIAAALSDFVGDPTLVAPVDAPSMHDEPEPPERLDPSETAVGLPIALAAEEPTSKQQPPRPPEPSVSVVAAPEPAAPGPRSADLDDPDGTLATQQAFAESGIEFFEPQPWEPWEPAAPPPPFEQPSERPLFAEEERRVPDNAPAASAPTPPAGTGVWTPDRPGPPYPGERDSSSLPRRRSGPKIFLVLLIAIGVAVAMYFAFVAGRSNDAPAGTPGTSTTHGTPTAAAPQTTPATQRALTGTPVTISAVGDFDPEGDPPSENPARAPLAIDGNLTTAWPTETYPSADLGGEKSGVGLVVDLGSQTLVSSVSVALLGAPTDVAFYATPTRDDTAPAELSQATLIGRDLGATRTAQIVVDPASPLRTRYLIIWLTKLPAEAGGYQGQIAEITVRS